MNEKPKIPMFYISDYLSYRLAVDSLNEGEVGILIRQIDNHRIANKLPENTMPAQAIVQVLKEKNQLYCVGWKEGENISLIMEWIDQ
jgi:hypothetical protein